MPRRVLERTNSVAAQAAAEASLQLADSRSAVLRERIEELMKQVEEADRSKKEWSGSGRRKLRHVYWPWRALKLTLASRTGVGGRSVASWVGTRNRRMMPEMEALLHFIWWFLSVLSDTWWCTTWSWEHPKMVNIIIGGSWSLFSLYLLSRIYNVVFWSEKKVSIVMYIILQISYHTLCQDTHLSR